MKTTNTATKYYFSVVHVYLKQPLLSIVSKKLKFRILKIQISDQYTLQKEGNQNKERVIRLTEVNDQIKKKSDWFADWYGQNKSENTSITSLTFNRDLPSVLFYKFFT
jgi:hypothetical protein